MACHWRIRFLAGGKVNISSIFEVTVLIILNVFLLRSRGIMKSWCLSWRGERPSSPRCRTAASHSSSPGTRPHQSSRLTWRQCKQSGHGSCSSLSVWRLTWGMQLFSMSWQPSLFFKRESCQHWVYKPYFCPVHLAQALWRRVLRTRFSAKKSDRISHYPKLYGSLLFDCRTRRLLSIWEMGI